MLMYCGCILKFHDKSADANPGYGVGEAHCGLCDYTSLRAITDWRYLLSNMAFCNIFDDYGNTYTSAEQNYQCNRVFCYRMDISYNNCYNRFKNLTGPESKKYANDIIPSDVYYGNLMEYAITYKVTQNDKIQEILLATGTSKLIYKNYDVGYIFEQLRSNL